MKSMMNFLFTRVKIFIRLDIIILLFLFFLFLFGHLLYQPIKLDSPILIPDSTLRATYSELSSHNLNLISTLQERESLDANSILSEDDGIRQTRSIYIGIIGVLLTFVLSKNESNRTYIVLLALIILFYGLDIHLVDMFNRSSDSKKITSSALELVVRQRPTDSAWYDINYNQRNSQFDKNHETRIARKLKAIFCPDIVQIVFFIVPLFTVYIISTLRYRKKQNAT